ncbi:putative pectinesterase 52 [Acorus calamus]|uniref:Pectinesterase 52 n=1 Tax=Acorus calamus TaxID=4465 RepID=A0AAV9CV37_ACOCL|nr:putative pectinesterase 52 [Acorus calamus]
MAIFAGQQFYVDNIWEEAVALISSWGCALGGVTSIRLVREGKPEPITQAVAVLVGGDKVAFYNCAFEGVQDTLSDQ